MNKELEKLVDYALVDGYISDKEKKVLIKKATEQGFDIDELEMILQGKLHETASENAPKVDKCPSCGEIMSGLSKVCPSCDYVTDAKSKKKKGNTLDHHLKEVNEQLDTINLITEPAAGRAVQVALATFFTGGIYLLYKKLSGKYIFDEKYENYKKNSGIIRQNIQTLEQAYGSDNEIKQILNGISAKLNEKDAARNKKTTIIACVSFVLIALMYFFAYKLYTMPPAPEKIAEEKMEKHLKNHNIRQARLMLGQIKKDSKEFYEEKILMLEIDSLVALKDYNQAILMTAKLDEGGYMETRQKKLDSIITIEVKELIEKKDFARARERAEMAAYSTEFDLEQQIKLAETIDNDNKKKHKK